MSVRRSYALNLKVNGRPIYQVIVDPHYEAKHPDITDSLILELVKQLDGREFQPEEFEGAWEFFMLDRIEHRGKLYRLIWCMRKDEPFIGVINCFRR